MSENIPRRTLLKALGATAMAARADDARHFSFAYDQPHSTGYGVAADGNRLS